MDELRVHTMAGVHRFFKPGHFKNQGVRRVTKGVHNLKFRHCLGVVAHKI